MKDLHCSAYVSWTRPNGCEWLWMLQGHFLGLTCICSYECSQSSAIQIRFMHWTNWQNYQFNGSDLPLWMLTCVNVSFYDSLSKQLVVYGRLLCIHPEPQSCALCSKPPAKTSCSCHHWNAKMLKDPLMSSSHRCVKVELKHQWGWVACGI